MLGSGPSCDNPKYRSSEPKVFKKYADGQPKEKEHFMARNRMLSVVFPALSAAPIYLGAQSVILNGGAHASGPFSRVNRVRVDSDYAAACARAGERELYGHPMRGDRAS
jgi:hypothetical protein